jgi:hypothetical protein
MDSVLLYGLTFGATFLSGPAWQLFSNFNTHVLAAFLILIGSIALPFLVALKAFVSDSVRTRLLSWTMLVASITISGEYYLYYAFWLAYAKSFLVPSLMTYPDYAVWVTVLIDVLIIYSVLTYSTRRIIHYLQGNLKTKFYRNQIPPREWVRRNQFKVFLIYWILAGFAMTLFFAP